MWLWILDNGTFSLGPCLPNLCQSASPRCHPHVPFQPSSPPWGSRVTFSGKGFGGRLVLQRPYPPRPPCPPSHLTKVTPRIALWGFWASFIESFMCHPSALRDTSAVGCSIVTVSSMCKAKGCFLPLHCQFIQDVEKETALQNTFLLKSLGWRIAINMNRCRIIGY